jgi:hypothetical protein
MFQHSGEIIVNDDLFAAHDDSDGNVADILQPIFTGEDALPNSHCIKKGEILSI